MSKIHNIGDAKPRNPQSNQKEVTVSRDELTIVECNGCESTLFHPAQRWGRLSAAHPKNQSGSAQYVPMQTHVCVQCGTEIDMGE